MAKIYLTVTAHPDDEALGFGASSYVLSQNGHTIYNCILSGKVDARRHKPDEDELKEHTSKSQKIMGAEPPILRGFPNIKFNTVPHLDLVQYIKGVIKKSHQAVYQGLGGSFDVYTGNVKRAPVWWVKHNLEWAYRLIKQPYRIKRQIHLVRFLVLLKLNQF